MQHHKVWRVAFLAMAVLIVACGIFLAHAANYPRQISDAASVDAFKVLKALAVWCAFGAVAMLLGAREARLRASDQGLGTH